MIAELSQFRFTQALEHRRDVSARASPARRRLHGYS